MRIVLERHVNPVIKLFMDTVASHSKAMGHDVAWWDGYFLNPGDPPFPPPIGDVAFTWNGQASPMQQYREYWRMKGTAIFYAEAGWYPQDGHYQVDHRGVNAAASWCSTPTQLRKQIHVVPQRTDEILVALQVEGDTQLTCFSPWVTMEGMLSRLGKVCGQTLVIRRHPRRQPSAQLTAVIKALPKWRWDDSVTLADALKKYDVMATVNSSSAVEAIAKGKAVLCFGEAVFRKRGAVVCLGNDDDETEKAIANLKAAPLWLETQKAVANDLVTRQWNAGNFRYKLSQLLARP